MRDEGADHDHASDPRRNLPDAYSDTLEKLSLAPLWAALHVLLPHERTTQVVPHHWRWADLRAPLLEAARLVGIEQAERRVLVLVNPGLAGAYAATATLYAGLQIILPGRERAEPSPHAGRAPARGRGPRRVHDGGRREVRDGAGRSHHHAADALARSRPRGDGARGLARRPRHPARARASTRAGPRACGPRRRPPRAPTRRRTSSRRPGSCRAARATRTPAIRRCAGRGAPSRRRSRRWRRRRRRRRPSSSATSTRARASGRSGRWDPRRSGCGPASGRAPSGGRASGVFHVVEGRGESLIGETLVTWEEGDCFVAPPWHWIEHRNHAAAAPACLFHLTDEPALRRARPVARGARPAPRLTGSRAAGRPRLGARRGNPARAMRRVQLRGGARWQPREAYARRGVRGLSGPAAKMRRFAISPLSRRPRAPTAADGPLSSL